MKRSKFTEEQIAFALRQAESGTAVTEVCRKMDASNLNACWSMDFVADQLFNGQKIRALTVVDNL
jgi:putative transposase